MFKSVHEDHFNHVKLYYHYEISALYDSLLNPVAHTVQQAFHNCVFSLLWTIYYTVIKIIFDNASSFFLSTKPCQFTHVHELRDSILNPVCHADLAVEITDSSLSPSDFKKTLTLTFLAYRLFKIPIACVFFWQPLFV